MAIWLNMALIKLYIFLQETLQETLQDNIDY